MSAKTAPTPAVAGSGRSKKKMLLIALPLAIGVAGAGGWFSGVIPRLLGHEEHGHVEASAHGSQSNTPASHAPVFMELPDIVANLNAGARRTSFVKLKAKLELAKPEDQALIQAAMPRILDLFQTYLREMRPEEMRGTASTYRLKEELAARTNIAAHPVKVLNVLFTEMLVQ